MRRRNLKEVVLILGISLSMGIMLTQGAKLIESHHQRKSQEKLVEKLHNALDYNVIETSPSGLDGEDLIIKLNLNSPKDLTSNNLYKLANEVMVNNLGAQNYTILVYDSNRPENLLAVIDIPKNSKITFDIIN